DRGELCPQSNAYPHRQDHGPAEWRQGRRHQGGGRRRRPSLPRQTAVTGQPRSAGTAAGSYIIATTSISIMNSGRTRPLTSIVVLAAIGLQKYFARKSACLRYSAISVTTVLLLTTWANVAPTSFSPATIFSPT